MNVDSAPVGGLMFGTVECTNDEAGLGRVKVRYGHLGESTVRTAWAHIATPMAGPDRGVWFVPEEGDQAVVGFGLDNPDVPIILGFLWDTQVCTPPSTATNERLIRTVDGSTIRFLDADPDEGGGRGALAIEDGNGNSIVMANGKVTVHAAGVLELDAASIVLTSCGVRRVVTPNANPI